MADLHGSGVGRPLRAARATLASLGLDSASLWCCEVAVTLAPGTRDADRIVGFC